MHFHCSLGLPAHALLRLFAALFLHAEVSAMATQVAQSQAELDQLKIALKQVEQFNEQEKSRILVQRKETSTLEDQMQVSCIAREGLTI